jgi:antitoxin component of MazEF toxin-antitoxin module
MSQRKLKDANTRKLTRLGASLVVSLPCEILNQLGWQEKQKLTVKKIRGGITIRDWHKH